MWQLICTVGRALRRAFAVVVLLAGAGALALLVLHGPLSLGGAQTDLAGGAPRGGAPDILIASIGALAGALAGVFTAVYWVEPQAGRARGEIWGTRLAAACLSTLAFVFIAVPGAALVTLLGPLGLFILLFPPVWVILPIFVWQGITTDVAAVGPMLGVWGIGIALALVLARPR